ncbi:hypothetical protein BCV69DRAFT_286838 [Microstroma glucosiphilum]|uniref:BZIP domain-containing protein n=1 Tax=Pseudomicrostroma glucosiphilum TaxID=1684307 RepID=A0A316UFB2_9BASI|nr:hypothetical protein BCV69DRAFT_286838 [Pseudomicrostroma glucosiphilum]PWN22583.1 hypothetical protein BCV69DRAFT_286838 [Pseudomicrostroma glucosiphilum]
MSSGDAGFPGWEHHRAENEDLYTSPLFTDTSPCLTDNSSFEPNSCDTSPLLANDLDASASEVAHMPLFGDMTLFSPYQATEVSFERAGATASTALSPNFSLFPDVHAPPSPPRGQMAFNPAATEPAEDSATMLLRALQGIANTHAQAQQAQPPVHSASPKLLTGDGGLDSSSSTVDATRLAKPPLQHSATAPVFSRHSCSFDGGSSTEGCQDDSSVTTAAPACTKRGVKRRLRVDDLLPLDAPIQTRNYLGPSSTSRKDWVPPSDVDAGPSAEELAAIQAESDPLKAKRLSNTLAARRSRHRKAAERAEFLARIKELEDEVSSWKRRCERAERERDELLGAARPEQEEEDESEEEQ